MLRRRAVEPTAHLELFLCVGPAKLASSSQPVMCAHASQPAGALATMTSGPRGKSAVAAAARQRATASRFLLDAGGMSARASPPVAGLATQSVVSHGVSVPSTAAAALTW
jgi:hypothetical protein